MHPGVGSHALHSRSLIIPPMPSRLAPLIRDIPDFPKPGIVFKDITPLLANAAGLALAVEFMANPFRGSGVDIVVGAESRGFIFGTAIAQALSCGFVPVRKPGKLPSQRISVTYDLEYGTDTLEIHADALESIRPLAGAIRTTGKTISGGRVLMVDDLLATGGTMRACCDLVRRLNATIVGVSVLIELEFLKGRERLSPLDVHSVVKY
jgi:adenine phosphoribosyltransferase